MPSINSTAHAYSSPGDFYYPTSGIGNCITVLSDTNSRPNNQSIGVSSSGGGNVLMWDVNGAYGALFDENGNVIYVHVHYDSNGCMQIDSPLTTTSLSGGTAGGITFSRVTPGRAYKVSTKTGDGTKTGLYQETLTGTTTVAVSRVKLFDYNNCPGVDGTLTSQAGDGNLNVSDDDRYYTTSLNFPPSAIGQNNAHWELSWDRTTGGCTTFYTGVSGLINNTPDINLDDSSANWRACGDPPCSGGTVTRTFSQIFNNTTNTVDGNSTKITCGSVNGANCLFWVKPGFDDTATNFTADFWAYFPSLTSVTPLEYDTFQVTPVGAVQQEFMWGTQCNYQSGFWQLWNMGNSTWNNTSVTCTSANWAAGVQHHYVLTVHRVPGDTSCAGAPCQYFDTLTLDGVAHALNVAYPSAPAPVTWTHVYGQNIQIDLKGSVTATENIDELTLTRGHLSTENPASGNIWSWCIGNCSRHGSNPAPLTNNTICAATGGIPAGIHNSTMTKDGTTAVIPMPCDPNDGGNYIYWTIGTGTLQHCSNHLYNCGGHGGTAFATAIDANIGITRRNVSDITTYTTIRPVIPGGIDMHGGRNWPGAASDNSPWMVSSNPAEPGWTCTTFAYCSEVMAIRMDGVVVRFAPNFHSYTVTGDLGAIPVMQPTGNCVLVESNWGATRGNNASGKPRKDAFAFCNLQ